MSRAKGRSVTDCVHSAVRWCQRIDVGVRDLESAAGSAFV